MTNIKNQQELLNAMRERAEKAISEASEEILKVFKNEYILKIVYIENPKQYERTMDFLNAWDWTPIRKSITTLVTEMWYNPGKMSYNIDKFQHGSIYSTPEVVIASLMDILNKKGYSSSLWLSVSRDKAYWDEFISDMISGGQLDRILTKHFSNNGFRRL